MVNDLIAIFEQNTALRKDVDLYYLEMPLGKAGLWFMDRQADNPRTGYREYDIFYRGKDKNSTIRNTDYLKAAIEDMTACKVNGRLFRLDMLFNWEYVGKDEEGYYVFSSAVRLLV